MMSEYDHDEKKNVHYDVKDHERPVDAERGHDLTKVNSMGIYDDDPNLDRTAIGDVEEDSPYPEVRSAVANTDDPSMPCGTIRAWVIGLMWAILIPGLNQYVNLVVITYDMGPLSCLTVQILLLPLSVRYHRLPRRSAAFLPSRSSMGSLGTQREDLRCQPQPWAFLNQRVSCLSSQRASPERFH